MKLNKRLIVALRVIDTLKGYEKPVNAEVLAFKANTTYDFVQQVLGFLRKENIVIPKRGPSGGYTLNTSKAIYAYQVADAVKNGFKHTLTLTRQDSESVCNLENLIRGVFATTKVSERKEELYDTIRSN